MTTPERRRASTRSRSSASLRSRTGFDQNQRFQFLSFTPGAGKVTVQPPATANLAPPGDYMLFLLNAQGVPSIAAIVRLQAAQDTTAPTAPTNLVASGAPGQVTLSWTAATDDVGVVRYDVHRSTTPGFTPSAGNRIAQPTGTGYTDSTVPAGTFYYKVAAEDLAGNIGPPSNEASATVAGSGPVAAYGFDEGAGTATADRTANGNNGTLANTSWAGASAGRFGNALSFNGSSSMVTVPDSDSLDLTTGMTLEAWVRPNAGGSFRTVVVKERPGDLVYGLYSSSDTNRPQSQVTVAGQARLLDGGSTLPAATWTHVAASYDGTTQRLYVNGAQVSSSTIAGSIEISGSPLRIGGNSIWAEWFTGLIDEVRVYRRALSAAEIQADMTTPITSQDAAPPSAPGTLSATGGLGQVALTWGAATDNTGVVRYNVHRSTTAGFTPSSANRIAQPTGTTYTNTGLAPGVYYFKVTAEDAAGNVGPPSNEANGTAAADTTPPTAPTNLTATGGAGQVALGWSASTDTAGIARYNVHRSTVAGFTTSSANRIAQPTGTSYTDTGLAAGTYYYRVIAEDPSGNPSTPSNEATATVSAAPPSGLVAAYSMDQGSGTSLPDLSGTGNNGTISGATWSTSGRFGSALSFNGTSSIVTVPDSSSLDLTTAMTLEAWVQPTSLGGKWRTVLMKEQSGDMVYDLYAHGGGGTKVPAAEVFVGGARTASGTTALTANTWSHLAATFDGATLRVYVNGTQVGQQAVAGSIATSTGALRIGGNTLWDEHYRRAHRRGPHLPACAHSHGDPGGHEPGGRQPRLPAADCSERPHRERGSNLRRPLVDGVDGQRRRRAVQRPPLYDAWLHAEHGQPRRTADGDELHRLGPRRGHLLLPRPRRGRSGQPLVAVERGERGRRRHDAAERPRDADRDRRDRQGDAGLGGCDGRRWASCATTSTAPRPRASRRARGTGSRSRRARATRTRRSAPGPTTTRSRPRTPRATSGRRRTRRARR